jgi:hypothetical protein
MMTRNLKNILLMLIAITTSQLAILPAAAEEPAGGLSIKLPARISNDWIGRGPLTTITREEWSRNSAASGCPDAAVCNEYGLLTITARSYYRKGAALKVEIFSARKTAGAYGLWTFMRRAPLDGSRLLQHDRYVVRLSGEGSLQIEASDEVSIFESIRALLGESDGQLPVLPAHLPQTGRIAGTEIYITGPRTLARDPQFGERSTIIDYSGLPEAVTADYQIGSQQAGSVKMRLMIVEFYTPQSATDNFSRWTQAIEQPPASGDAPRRLKRIGNYIVEIAGASDQKIADELFGQIRYEQKVFWSGRKLSDIPLEFRPLDPAALREATRTGSIIVRSLVWVGVMLALMVGVGLLFGGAFFYWRIFNDRRQGFNKMFSDGGGSILLNLDENIQSEESRQQLESEAEATRNRRN